ncbi:MAG: carboxylesterase/lipase family protein [Acidimicrobiales bacterium]
METVVSTEQGRVLGAVEKRTVAFLGIPYAAPPVGEARFAPPAPPERWEGTRDALVYGATALQPHQEFTLIPEPLVQGDNCLNLNVFTPDPGTSGLPVLVWIHGGGFFAGCNASPWYRGEHFARDGVVLVSINYRLGIEGFLAVEDGGANRGVLDWLAALEWVQHNIEAFGGDPLRVTVAGQSAGGVAAALLLSMPRARGLLRRAICMSGPVALVGTAEQGHETARAAGEELGTRLTRSALSQVPPDRLLETQARLMPLGPGGTPDLQAFGRSGPGMLPLAPCVDGDIVPCAPLEAVRTGSGASCDLLAGTTTEEFNMVFALLGGDTDDNAVDRALLETGLSAQDARAYRDSLPGKAGAEILGQALTDRMFRVPTEDLCDARTGADGRTYLYQSAWRSPAMGGVLGAAHCVDIPFAFDNLDAPGVEVALGPEPPQGLADQMHRAWVGFVSHGDPGWPSFGFDTRPALVFDGESAVVNDSLRLPRSLWGAA